MTTKIGRVLPLVIIYVTGCVDAGEIPGKGDEPAAPASYVPIRVAPNVKFAPGPGADPLPIYLNRSGGTFTAGTDDSANNVSSVVSYAGVSSATVPAYNGSNWGQVVSCVQQQFSRFNVVVTDVEPAGGIYVEAVFGGDGSAVGFGGYGGVAPIDSSTCQSIPNAIVYIFTDNLGGSAQVMCEVAAQEIAHAFSLDHQYLCEDPMTYLSGCGAKSFQDVDAQCGEYEPRACICGRPSQNSVQVLYEKLGVAGGGGGGGGGEPPPPPPEDPPADNCGGIDYYGTCSADGTLTWCQDGELQTIDCAAGGYTCGWQDDNIGNNCLPPPDGGGGGGGGEPPPPTDACGGIDYPGTGNADGTLTWCEGGALQTLDCASAGYTCGWQDDTIGNNCLAPATDACGGIDYYGTCTGTTLQWCQDGALQTVDCGAYGMSCGWQDDSIGNNCL